jgi:hypothetical protein
MLNINEVLITSLPALTLWSDLATTDSPLVLAFFFYLHRSKKAVRGYNDTMEMTLMEHGVVCGAMFFNTQSPKISRINRVVCVFEAELSEDMSYTVKDWEWK